MYLPMEKEYANQVWSWFLVGDKNGLPGRVRRSWAMKQVVYRLLPAKQRCILCGAPLGGAGALVTGRIFGMHRSALTPHLCSRCGEMVLNAEGGAKVELSMLIADIGGPTSKIQRMSASEYRKFTQRFHEAASEVLIRHGALVNRLVGDHVIGLFVPRLVGENHSKAAIEAAFEVLKVMGHEDKDGPWAPTGIGVHTQEAYVGAVELKDGVKDVTVQGDAANLAARLSTSAGKGEVLISDEAAQSANIVYDLEKRKLQLKGIIGLVDVGVIKVEPQ